MDPKYIVAIVTGGIFLILFIVFIIIFAHKRKTEARLQARLEQEYSDENLAKMEYDFAVYDEETAKILSGAVEKPVTQVSIYDVLSEDLAQPEEVFGKIESEGMEEITGNYKPDKKNTAD